MIDLSKIIPDREKRDRAILLYRELNQNYAKMIETYVESYAKLEFSVQFKFKLQELKGLSGYSFEELKEMER